MASKKKLIFVYNADSSLFGTITDFAHKIVSPASYQCKLCSLTYGAFMAEPAWKNFIKKISVRSIFLHRDQFLKHYKTDDELPAIFQQEGTVIATFISKEEINKCRTLDELMALITARLLRYDQHNNSDI